jgi:hypothetical protein
VNPWPVPASSPACERRPCSEASWNRPWLEAPRFYTCRPNPRLLVQACHRSDVLAARLQGQKVLGIPLVKKTIRQYAYWEYELHKSCCLLCRCFGRLVGYPTIGSASAPCCQSTCELDRGRGPSKHDGSARHQSSPSGSQRK